MGFWHKNKIQLSKSLWIYLIVFLIVVSQRTSFAQPTIIDSLQEVLVKDILTDSSRINILNEMSKAYWRIAPDTALHMARQAYKLASNTSSQYGIISSARNIGASFFFLGKLDSTLVYWKETLKHNTIIGDSSGISKSLSNLGLVYEYKGNYPRSLDFYLKALKLQQSLSTSPINREIGITHNNLGNLYEKLEYYTQSLFHHHKALSIRKELQHKPHLSSTYMNIAIVYDNLKKQDSAQIFYHKALAIKQELKDNYGMVGCMLNLGYLKLSLAERDSAKIYFNIAEDISIQLGLDEIQAEVLTGKALLELELKKPLKTIQLGKKAEKTISTGDNIQIQKKLYEVLHKAYAESGNFQQAYQYHQKLQQTLSEMLDKDRLKQIGRLEAEYSFEMERLSKKQEQTKKEASLKEELLHQRFFRSVTTVVSISLLIIGILVYRAYRISNKRHRDLQVKQEEIAYLNSNLESLIQKRTEELEKRNQVLAKYAYTNSHKVRGPIARLLGLVYLFKKADSFSKSEDLEIALKAVADNIEELDQVIKEISKEL